jgi:hypothetical protein
MKKQDKKGNSLLEEIGKGKEEEDKVDTRLQGQGKETFKKTERNC